MKRVMILPIVWAFVAGVSLLGCSKNEMIDLRGSEEQSQTDDNDDYYNTAYVVIEESEAVKEIPQEEVKEEQELKPITFSATVADWDDE